MNEIIIAIVIEACKFDDTKIDKEKRIACAEEIVNCVLNKKILLDTCINSAKKELK